MTNYEILRLAVWSIGLPIIVYLVWRILRRIRDIRELDARLREEEAANAHNPYAQMARLFETQQLLDEVRGKKKRR